jgi:EAL domain-containing protein (putative c-di-GMP-specific phosphodiesterase class I)/GGDEF domain-containing protein
MSQVSHMRHEAADESALLTNTESLINELGPVQAFSSRIAEKVFVYSCLIAGIVVIAGYSYLALTQVRAGAMPIQRLLPLPFGVILLVIGLAYIRRNTVPRGVIWLMVTLLIAAIPVGLTLNGPISTSFLLVFAVFFHLILRPNEALVTCFIVVAVNIFFIYFVFPFDQIEIPQRLLINSILVIGLMQFFSRTFVRLVEGSRKTVGLLNAQASFLQSALDSAEITDPTTRVLNSAGFTKVLGAYCTNERQRMERACLVVVRVNHLHLEPRLLDLGGEATFYGLLINRIKQFLPNNGLIGRLGQNDFAFLVPHSNVSKDAIANKCRHIQKSLNSPVNFLARKIEPDIRMGVVVEITKEFGPEILMQQALLAMHEATLDKSQTLISYDSDVNQRFLENQRLIAALDHALSKNEMQLHYQAIVDLKTGVSHKAEALIRWVSADLGPVSPNVFIPFAESNNTIDQITDFVLQSIALHKKQWIASCGLCPDISVNISPATLKNPDTLLDLLEQYFPADSRESKGLNIEITEGLQITATQQTENIINELKARGFQVSFDDFGTGYSSLSYLNRFPVDYLKIDQSFVRGIELDSSKEAVVNAIIQVAHQLGIQVIAEGVENEQQRQILLKVGCDFGQGYLFSRPQDPDEFAHQWLSSHRH